MMNLGRLFRLVSISSLLAPLSGCAATTWNTAPSTAYVGASVDAPIAVSADMSVDAPVQVADNDPAALAEARAVLESYGVWYNDPTYGTVWTPHASVVGADFTPYVSAGHWTYDEDYTWVSDYEWGWLPFHYGRWTYIAGRGWAWIAGREYSGAWVTWRTSDESTGYVGWAPAAPTYYWSDDQAVAFAPSVTFETNYYFCNTTYLFAPTIVTYVVTAPATFLGGATRAYLPSGRRRGPVPSSIGIVSASVVTTPRQHPGLQRAWTYAKPSVGGKSGHVYARPSVGGGGPASPPPTVAGQGPIFVRRPPKEEHRPAFSDPHEPIVRAPAYVRPDVRPSSNPQEVREPIMMPRPRPFAAISSEPNAQITPSHPPVIPPELRPPMVMEPSRPSVIPPEVRPPMAMAPSRPSVVPPEVRPPMVMAPSRPPVIPPEVRAPMVMAPSRPSVVPPEARPPMVMAPSRPSVSPTFPPQRSAPVFQAPIARAPVFAPSRPAPPPRPAVNAPSVARTPSAFTPPPAVARPSSPSVGVRRR